ncbi:hypothetical protein [Tenacibaculum maritimum]|uniref:hypothetical protein n=1 Tax=Tenacibaculum maritimum TaxID=107401 RepID=UPI001E40B3F0|nr:hypothetical protein [Tenacibaculum maritimum]MCD9611939.1 hypothetical protein [Tenacibaculum maritimum]
MSFITSEKPVRLDTLEKGTCFVKSSKGLPCSQILKVGSLIDYCSFDYFLCEKIDGTGNLLLRESCLVIPLTSPRYYPTFNDLVTSNSLSFDLDSFQFIRDYFDSLPFDYLQSVEGNAFFKEYLHFLSLFKNNLLDIINKQDALIEFLNNKFSNQF